jgi:hypothetical protein
MLRAGINEKLCFEDRRGEFLRDLDVLVTLDNVRPW